MNEVYKDMAAAIKRRDHAVVMLSRWQQVLSDAEEQIKKLSGALSNAANADTVFDQLVADTQSYEQD